MAREISESDWKVLKQLHAGALNRFCERVLSEVNAIAADASRTPHQRYLALFETVQRRDEEIVTVFDDLRRSTALRHIVALRKRELLEDSEFMRLSEETRALVGTLGRRANTDEQ